MKYNVAINRYKTMWNRQGDYIYKEVTGGRTSDDYFFFVNILSIKGWEDEKG